jgi:EAL domain-containing protein (putative c-di-GMP-specific phosphodiesterase class I)
MVETAEEADILRRAGVGFLQGYYFGKPTLEKPWLQPHAAPASPLGAVAGR